MMRTFWRAFLAVLGAALVAVSPAHAERDASQQNGVWRVVDGGGCKLILNLGVFYLDPSLTKTEYTGFPVRSITWSGPCGANGLANGTGSITIWVQQFINGNRFTDYRTRWTGQMRNGIMVGSWTGASTNFDSSRGDYEPYQGWDEPTLLTEGCDKEWDFGNQCNPQDAYRLQAQFGPTQPPAPAPQMAVAPAAAPMTSSGGVSAGGGGSPVLDTVASGLLAALGPKNAVGYGTGNEAMDTVLATLRSSLVANGNAALGGNAGLLEAALAAARTALGGATPNSTNAQLADLVMRAVKGAVSASGPSSVSAAPPARPVPAAPSTSVMGSLLGGMSAPAKTPAPVPAPARPPVGLITAADIETVAAYLASKGDDVTRGFDFAGLKMLSEVHNRYVVNIMCEENLGGCYAFRLQTCSSAYPGASLSKVNDWNRRNLFGEAYLNESNELCFRLVVVTGKEGVQGVVVDPLFGAFKSMIQDAGVQFN